MICTTATLEGLIQKHWEWHCLWNIWAYRKCKKYTFGKRSIIIYQRAPLKWHLRAWEGTGRLCGLGWRRCTTGNNFNRKWKCSLFKKVRVKWHLRAWEGKGGCADSEGGGAILAPIHAPYCNLAALHDALAKRKMQKYNMQNDKYFLTWCIRLSVLSTSVHQGFTN